jgi:hypothetical protein
MAARLGPRFVKIRIYHEPSPIIVEGRVFVSMNGWFPFQNVSPRAQAGFFAADGFNH